MADGSHPVRGAWIEIYTTKNNLEKHSSRTPSGVRGLK